MIREHTLARTPLLRLVRFDHPEECLHQDPAEEVAECFSLNFAERGGFDLQFGRRHATVLRGTVFLTQPGMRYRCRHASDWPDDVFVSLEMDSTFVRDAWRFAGQGPAWRTGVMPSSNRLEYLRERLLRAAASTDALALEGIAGELLAAMGEGNSAVLFGARQVRWYAERVDFVRELLEREYAQPHSLAALGRRVGMSAFHFAHVFRELTGTPPHRYLLGARLAHAAERLRQGATVTDTCYAVGFSNLSHFIRSFRRNFRVSPSRFR